MSRLRFIVVHYCDFRFLLLETQGVGEDPGDFAIAIRYGSVIGRTLRRRPLARYLLTVATEHSDVEENSKVDQAWTC